MICERALLFQLELIFNYIFHLHSHVGNKAYNKMIYKRALLFQLELIFNDLSK